MLFWWKYQNRMSIAELSGTRAGFDGLYAIPPQACEPNSVTHSRQAFIKHYKNKQYQLARNVLESTHNDCKDWIFWTDELDIRNDLAITYYFLKDKQACIQVLKPFTDINITKTAPIEDADSNVWDLIGSQPSYQDWAQKAIVAARTNLKFCGYKFSG